MNSPLRFAIFGNIFQGKKSLAIQKLLALLEERNAEIMIDRPLYDFLVNELKISIHPDRLIQGSDFEADIAISMGGDGTFLEAARRVGDKEIPILGINMGRQGFLADFSPEEIEDAIAQIYDGTLRTESRSVLQVAYSKGRPKVYPYALNEVAVLKRDSSSMISIRVNINGEYLTTYQADGLIINTPTGSTGYALSVGGPIMAPDSHIMGLAPVSPHSLSARPITLSDDMEVELSVESRSHNFLVAIDGRNESCTEGTRLSIRKAPYQVHVLKRSRGSYFRTLRTKLMWGTDVRSEL